MREISARKSGRVKLLPNLMSAKNIQIQRVKEKVHLSGTDCDFCRQRKIMFKAKEGNPKNKMEFSIKWSDPPPPLNDVLMEMKHK